MNNAECAPARSIEQLTVKERAVLKHLSQHKTSKQIARDLDLNANTVDKHLAAVRGKWGTRDRYETARVFTQLAEGRDENHPPQFPPGDEYLISPSDGFPDLPRSPHFRLSDVLAREPHGFAEHAAPWGLEALDARFGTAWRIAAIPVVALLIGVVMIAGVAISRALSEMF